MNKNDVLFYGALLESDRYKDGYGSTEKDAELLQEALKKLYNITETSSEEDISKAEKQMQDDFKQLVIEYREKVNNFMNN